MPRPSPRTQPTATARLAQLQDRIVRCQACPRLVRYREEVARVKRRAYRAETYWGRPVPGFGDPAATIAVVGLAPGAHGANRTGRMFTGDRSGDFLYAALHRAGLANQPTSRSRDDGLRLTGVYISATCRCAPPDNLPTKAEIASCSGFLREELTLLSRVRVLCALGAIGYRAALGYLSQAGELGEGAPPPFSHGIEVPLRSGRTLIASYHVSQQNTQTGRLTPAMFDAVVKRAVSLAG